VSREPTQPAYTDDGYWAAFVGDCVLTLPEHAHLLDDDLIREAMATASIAGLAITADGLLIGWWIDHGEYERPARKAGE